MNLCTVLAFLTTLFSFVPLGITAPTEGRAVYYHLYYAYDSNWRGMSYPVEFSWDEYTDIIYVYAETRPDVTRPLPVHGLYLHQFVEVSHSGYRRVRVYLSIGGLYGSKHWSSNVGSEFNLTAFVKTLTDLAQEYKVDGLHFDWRSRDATYPNDSENFLAFLQLMREDPLGKKLTLSVYDQSTPPLEPCGTFSSQFDQYLDWLTGDGDNERPPLNVAIFRVLTFFAFVFVGVPLFFGFARCVHEHM